MGGFFIDKCDAREQDANSFLFYHQLLSTFLEVVMITDVMSLLEPLFINPRLYVMNKWKQGKVYLCFEEHVSESVDLATFMMALEYGFLSRTGRITGRGREDLRAYKAILIQREIPPPLIPVEG